MTNSNEKEYRQMDPDFGRAEITGQGYGEIDSSDYEAFCELINDE